MPRRRVASIAIMHVASAGFFDVGPDDSDSERAVEVPPTPPWLQPPQDVIPGRVLLDELVHRDDATAVLLREVRVYPDGVELRIRWVRRRRGESEREWHRWIQERHMVPPSDDVEPDDLHVGVRLADGTRVLPLGMRRAWQPGSDRVPPTLTVLGGGGGGGLDQYDGAVNAWLWLGGPVEGALEAVLQWRAIGLDETSVLIPAELVQTAPSARPLWP